MQSKLKNYFESRSPAKTVPKTTEEAKEGHET